MKKSSIAVTTLALTVAAVPAWACSMAGPNKHIGAVQAVNKQEGTFTIIDAETRQPITFSAGETVLKQAADNRKVTVSYKEAGDRLVAETLEF